MKTLENPLAELLLEQLPQKLQEAAARVGWTALMPVQSKAIPYLLEARNMLIQARTGSGKTGAFLLPMLERLNSSEAHTQALILVPTRELAVQVFHEAEKICGDNGFKSAAVYGGVGYKPQIDALKQGAHIVVGTPGRVLDHLLKRNMSLEHLKMLVFDEADRMLSMGFYPDMKKLRNYLPEKPIHRCMFSATFPGHVMGTANEFIRNPEFISLSEDQMHVSETEHVFYLVPPMEKDRCMVRIIEIENPASAIIFCNTKSEVNYVTVVLQRFGYDADQLTSDLSQNARERVLERVRKGNLRFLVATDLAARGLDVPQLSHVFQYQQPEDPEIYIHRTGRTGRAGAAGVAISLVSEVEKYTLDSIVRRYEIPLQEWTLPTDEDVQKIVSERLTALLESRLRDRDKLKTERSKRFEALTRQLLEDEHQLEIITMLLDDYYQKMLHEPLLPPPEPQRVKKSYSHGRSRKKRYPRK